MGTDDGDFPSGLEAQRCGSADGVVVKNPPQVPGEVMKTGSEGKTQLVQEAVDRTVSVPSPVGGEEEWKEFHLKQDAGCDLTVEAVVDGFDRDKC